MDRPNGSPPSLDRRTLLGTAAGLAAGVPAGVASAGRTDRAGLSVLTWNVYLGVNLSDLTEVGSMNELRDTAGDLLADAEEHPYEERTAAIAAEIDATDPDVVALQEVARITRRDADGGTTEIADVLELIVSALGERGRDYEVAVSTVTTDVALTGETDDGEVEVGLTDRDAILVRGDLETGDTGGGRYDESITFPLPNLQGLISLQRGYCTAEIGTNGGAVTVASTHLESRRADTRRRQAEQLLEVVPSEGPVVLAGDFNSGPGAMTDAYDRLTETFADAYADSRPDADGYTCCQALSLRNDESVLNRRVEGVLYRGGPAPTAAERVAADPGDRFELEAGGETAEMWPSDHAGVRATFELPDRSNSTEAATRTTGTPRTPTSPAAEDAGEAGARANATAGAGSDSPSSTAGADGATSTRPERTVTADVGSGMGVLAAVAGVAGGLFARWRRE